jgi:ergothioneine biosynthesis protein EgtB
VDQPQRGSFVDARTISAILLAAGTPFALDALILASDLMSTTTSKSIDRSALLDAFRRVRRASVEMCRPLAPEMYRVQPMEDVSPPWWNLGHTSWFFVRNLLQPFGGGSDTADDDFDYVLNSYYASLGPRLARFRRGSITRPSTQAVYGYRESVDRRVEQLLETIDEDRWDEFERIMTIGLNHEQQHQELFYTEIKYILWNDPPRLRVPYRSTRDAAALAAQSGRDAHTTSLREMQFAAFDGGLFEFGHAGPGWCWDNELPAHQQFLEPFALADRLITNREFQEFIDDDGYAQQLLWLDNGWNSARQENWQAPLYWEHRDGQWHEWTLDGLQPLDPLQPVCHVSFYEADAFARWRSQTWQADGAVRLPDERQWEHAARLGGADAGSNAFFESGRLHPQREHESLGGLRQMFGQVWQWTSSYYEPYLGYKPFAGNLSEYNSKFMDNQRVLRGGSCVTPRDHFRVSYRNFWHAATRFQFTGIRLARDLEH